MAIFKRYSETLRNKYCTTMFISKVTMIALNSFFIALDLTISAALWVNIRRLESIKIDLPEPEMDSIVETKLCGIVLANIIVLTISVLGIVGAARANSNMLITYDVIGLIAIVVLALGWRNYAEIRQIYLAGIAALAVALCVALVYVKAIKDEPYRIRRKLLLANRIHLRESIMY